MSASLAASVTTAVSVLCHARRRRGGEHRRIVVGIGQRHGEVLHRRIGAVVSRHLHGIAVRIHLEVARANELELVAPDDREQRLIRAAGDAERGRVRADRIGIGGGQGDDRGRVLATLGVADEVNTGALSFTSPTVIVNSRSALSAPTVARAVRL